MLKKAKATVFRIKWEHPNFAKARRL